MTATTPAASTEPLPPVDGANRRRRAEWARLRPRFERFAAAGSVLSGGAIVLSIWAVYDEPTGIRRWVTIALVVTLSAAAAVAGVAVLRAWRALHTIALHLGEAEEVLADVREREEAALRAREAARRRIRGVLDADLLALVYQPIFDLRTGELFGCEALSRIASPPVRPPDAWFAEAMAVGLGPEFEAKAVEKAIGALARLPDNVVVAANLSPETVFSPYLLGVLGAAEDCASRLVLEITEHAAVDHYEALVRMLARLRRLGVRIAVDDAGAGYASFHHILNLSPDIIKLDKVLIDTIDTDTARQALVRALRAFAAEIGSRLCAEGVERPEQLEVLVHLGVDLAQGYLFARPGPLDDVFDAGGHTVTLPVPVRR